MYKVEIAEPAEDDLRAAYNWYEENASALVAERWKKEILRKADSLAMLPRRCPYAPEHFNHELELRCIRCFSHLLIFSIYDDRVIVKRIRHSKQMTLPSEEIE